MIDNELFFKMLSDNTRLRCLMLMQAMGELCVCELTHALSLSQPKISRHLAHLREAQLLLARREGTWMYYRINPQIDAWATTVLETTLQGIKEQPPYISDFEAVKEMTKKSTLNCCS